MGIPESKLAALSRYRDSGEFDDLERAVLDFVTAASKSPAEVPDDLRGRLRRELGDDAVVQLAAIVAIESFLGRFNRAVGIESQGYSEKGACLIADHHPG